jgi:hypothetical protein
VTDPKDTPPVDAEGQPPTPDSPETPERDGVLRKQPKPSGPNRPEA